jgi:hypothetical protein
LLSIFATVASVKVFVGKAERSSVIELCDWMELRLSMVLSKVGVLVWFVEVEVSGE